MESTIITAAPPAAADKSLGRRENGKNWHAPRKAFRPKSGLSTFAQRMKQREVDSKIKAEETKMKEIKATERQSKIEAIKSKRLAKEERLRFEKLEEKMHKKRVERLKRKEKRNKLLNS